MISEPQDQSSLAGKVEDRLVRASLGGGSHISPGKLTTETGTGEGKERWEQIHLDLILYDYLDGNSRIGADKHVFNLVTWVGIEAILEIKSLVGNWKLREW